MKHCIVKRTILRYVVIMCLLQTAQIATLQDINSQNRQYQILYNREYNFLEIKTDVIAMDNKAG
jgi:hypothetical protein